MKRTFAMLLLLSLVLGACGQGTPDVTTDTTAATAEQTTSNTQETENATVGPRAIAPQAPEVPCENLIEHDPDRQIYFTCGNYDIDIYLDSSSAPYVAFWILSREPQDIANIQVDVPVECNYHIQIAQDMTKYMGKSFDWSADTDSNLNFSEALYFSYFGAIKDGSTVMITDDNGEEISLEKAYQKLKAEDLPQFYVYAVEIKFDSYGEQKDEAFSEIDVTLSGEVYHLDIGEVRLHDKLPLDYSPEGLNELGSIGFQIVGPYKGFWGLCTEGLGEVMGLFRFTAEYDLELFECHLLDPKEELLDLRVIITGNQNMDFYWNGEDRIYIYEGDTVEIRMYYRDERQNELNYEIREWAILNYECDTGCYSAYAECALYRMLTVYEWYAIVFDGVDLEPYYRYYRERYESAWRDKYAS